MILVWMWLKKSVPAPNDLGIFLAFAVLKFVVAFVGVMQLFANMNGQVMVGSFDFKASIGFFYFSYLMVSIFLFGQLAFMLNKVQNLCLMLMQKSARELDQATLFNFFLVPKILVMSTWFHVFLVSLFILALGILESLTRTLETIFFAFFHAWIATQ